MFGLVERLRYVSGEYGVHGAHDYQHDRVPEGYHVRGVDERRTHQYVGLSAGIMVYGPRPTDHHPHAVDEYLLRFGRVRFGETREKNIVTAEA